MSTFDAVELIRTKRDGGRLGDEAIDWLIRAYTDGVVTDEQMSAMAMAIFFRGLDGPELTRWTNAMIATGERMDFSSLSPSDGRQALHRRRGRQDHAAAGAAGGRLRRGRPAAVRTRPRPHRRHPGQAGGHPRLAGEPQQRRDAAPARSRSARSICAAGAGLAPADKKLYALRDVTATVESIPMISASIMSKKIAEGTAALVLDVKTGAGAFMKTFERVEGPRHRPWSDIGKAAGVNTVALITDMDTPLGRTAGNGLEVAESVEVLAGGGPADVVELTLALAREMLACAGIDADPADVLASGKAMDAWKAMIRAQGGDPDAPLPVAKHTEVVTAEADGYLTGMDAMAVGLAAWRLGAGRAVQGDPVQAAAGVTWHAGVGDQVRAGQPLFTLHTDTPERIERAQGGPGRRRRRCATAARGCRRPADRARADQLPSSQDGQSSAVGLVDQAPEVAVVEGLPGGLDHVGADPDGGPGAVAVGHVDQRADDRVRAVALVEDAHLVVGQLEVVHLRVGVDQGARAGRRRARSPGRGPRRPGSG